MRLIDGNIQAMFITNFILERKEKIIDILQKRDNDYLFALMMNYFDEQPTAYDIDKIVEELEKREEHYVEMLDWQGQSAICDAIEIVKQGGVSDDVCEWKFEDEEANLYLTGCQQRQLIFDGTPKENGYRYCPYCGKKIKEVE